MRYYTFLSKNGNIPESSLSLDAAIGNAKMWNKCLNADVMIVSYEYSEETITSLIQQGKTTTEGIVIDGEFHETENNNEVVIDDTRWRYILNPFLTPSPYLVGS